MDNPPVILPKIGNMTAPFTQGGLWLVRYTNLFDKLERIALFPKRIRRGDS